MTKTALKSYIQKDIRKLEREKKKITPTKKGKYVTHRGNEMLLTYVTARYHTLKEILNFI